LLVTESEIDQALALLGPVLGAMTAEAGKEGS
jgi:hypothetical protein